MNRREPGYYWLKDKDQWGIGEWYVAANCAVWFIPGDERTRKDSDFQEIDENRIVRREGIREVIERTCRDDGGPAFKYP